MNDESIEIPISSCRNENNFLSCRVVVVNLFDNAFVTCLFLEVSVCLQLVGTDAKKCTKPNGEKYITLIQLSLCSSAINY